MSAHTPIYEKSRWYSVFLWIASHYIHRSFRHYKCIGLDQIPDDGSLIFAPNHCDALMDPLAVLAVDGSTKVFVARADIFSSLTAQKILTFMKILPIHRMRDGLHNVLKTEETIEKSIDVVEHNVRFCILPEGKHRPKHSLMPFGKGLSRIAYGAYKRTNGSRPIYIVPVGCEYGDYFRYRSSLLLKIGKPVDVTRYIEEHPEFNENEILQGIKNFTFGAIRDQIVYIPDDEDYDAVWTLSRIFSGRICKKNLTGRFDANRDAVGRILKFKAADPEGAASLLERARKFDSDRRKRKISLEAFPFRKALPHFLQLALMMLLGFPLFLAAAAVSLPTWLTAELIAVRAKDRAFRNSLRCVTIMVLWSLLTVLAVIPAPFFTYDYFELARQTASAWRILYAKKLKKEYETLCASIDGLPAAD